MSDEDRKRELEARLRSAREEHAVAHAAAQNAAGIRRDALRDALASGLLSQVEVARILGVGKARVGQIAKSAPAPSEGVVSGA